MDNLLEDLLNNPEEEEGLLAQVIAEEDKKLLPLLGEINFIVDNDVRSFVRSVLLRTDVFWDIPSDFCANHPPDELSRGGNVLHTKRVARVIKIMTDVEGREQYDMDLIVAAALLHDTTKGVKTDGVIDFDPLHAYTVDALVKNCVKSDEQNVDMIVGSSTLFLDDFGIGRILRLIRCHQGFASPIPETYPISTPDWILHWANVIASNLHYVIEEDDFDIERWMAYVNQSEVAKEVEPAE